MNEFGEYLKKLRGNKSLREVTKFTGISHTYLSTLEKGYDPRTKKERKPAPDVLRKLAGFYNVPYSTLLYMAGYIDEGHQASLTPNEESISVIISKVDKDGNPLDRGESMRRLMDVFHMLDKDGPTFYNGKQLTKEQKRKAISVLNAIFE